MAHRAVVIGGSLGGLFAGNLLRQAGWDAVVFERASDDLASRGAGLATHPELLAVLRRIGVTVDDGIGVASRGRICFDAEGHLVGELDRRQFMTAWARLYRALRAHVPDDAYHPGKALAAIEQDAEGITAIFADGSRERGQLLVGADGVQSTVRRLLLPEALPRYAGYIVWRGVAPEPAVAPDVFRHYVNCLVPGELFLGYPVPGPHDDVRPGHRGFNWGWYRPVEETTALPALCTDAAGRCHGTSIPPPLIRPEVRAAFRAEVERCLAPQVAAVIRATPQPFFQAIFDLRSPRLALGRAVLLGDAAFVARPHCGAGVTKAAIDAAALAEALSEAADLPAALARYETRQRRFGEAMVEWARWLGHFIEAGARPGSPGAALDGMPETPEAILRHIGAPLREIPTVAPLLD